MAVEAGRRAVSRPSCVCNTRVRVENLGQIWLFLLNESLQLCDLADLLESQDLILLVPIDCKTSRVVTTVFEAGQAVDQGVENVFPILLHQVIDAAYN
jgi:hypothetical protein